ATAGSLHFFFQAEGGIRDFHVTGVQTCALPIYGSRDPRSARVVAKQLDVAVGLLVDRVEVPVDVSGADLRAEVPDDAAGGRVGQIGRASCRERGQWREVAGVHENYDGVGYSEGT